MAIETLARVGGFGTDSCLAHVDNRRVGNPLQTRPEQLLKTPQIEKLESEVIRRTLHAIIF
jgi:hypothetical protein